jgi:L-threonine-O-3-phosphate decarboxylase
MTTSGPEPRSELSAIKPVPHGAADAAELARHGVSSEDAVDFSANLNPFAPKPEVRTAMEAADPAAYPDPEATAFREAAAGHIGVSAERVIASNGSVELLWLIALAFIRPGDRVLVVGPTFGEYERAGALMGGIIHHRTARMEEGFRVPADAVEAALTELAPRAVFLCSPNNPTGTLLDRETLDRWAERFPGTLFVVDEAYHEFVEPGECASALELVRRGRGNVAVLRSMTKAHGLAGLRLGYAVASEEIAAALKRVRPPWNVNEPAQRAGAAALRDTTHLQRDVQRLHAGKRQLSAGLRERELRPVPSAAPFFLVPVGDAAAVRRDLLRRGLVVRDCTSFGLPGCIRISPRTEEANDQLLRALREVL